jgi:hypothetical protein
MEQVVTERSRVGHIRTKEEQEREGTFLNTQAALFRSCCSRTNTLDCVFWAERKALFQCRSPLAHIYTGTGVDTVGSSDYHLQCPLPMPHHMPGIID